jgi:hypothetical protein
MKFARTYIKYIYSLRRHPHDWANWHGEGNIGDAIQCLALEHLYLEMGLSPENLVLINRDALDKYDGEPCLLPLNGWFGYFADIFPFPWSEKITPGFSGFHLTSTWESRERFIAAGLPERLRAFQPLGCRDRGTMHFLRSQGLDAYLSGCLTLLFPRRAQEPAEGRIFLVDLEEEVKKRLPPAILRQADESITHYYYFPAYPVAEKAAEEFEAQARAILERYRQEAALVITSRLHAALPCLALGVPLVFIDDKGGSERFDALAGLTPIYRPEDMGTINWHPPAPNLEKIKAAARRNFRACFQERAAACGLSLPDEPPLESPCPGEFEGLIKRLEDFDLLLKERQIQHLNGQVQCLEQQMQGLEQQIQGLERQAQCLKDGLDSLKMDSVFLKFASWAERRFGLGPGIRRELAALRRLAAGR